MDTISMMIIVVLIIGFIISAITIYIKKHTKIYCLEEYVDDNSINSYKEAMKNHDLRKATRILYNHIQICQYRHDDCGLKVFCPNCPLNEETDIEQNDDTSKDIL